MSTTEFRVTGMTCGHCEMSVREEVGELPGVQVLEVDASSGRLVVGGDQVDEAQVLAAVEEAGYTAEPVR
ncbi:heavy-metal-associated domain-containing protein [Phycicoccus jejuensis]|uniref:heavy-metal-associated domain-containing protein n=1 Tax=Phycicoccus TaxID=367298 RepID=UPI0004C3CA7C|nr:MULTISPECIES: heavy-metal-associated domain-containing protein [Phycicoccus]GIL37748.1 copper chaperone [Phycicoccus sp. DTK01]